MDEKILNLTDQIEKKRKHRKYWKNIFMVLAVVVVFCTTYALILPAITQERQTFCGYERHEHGDACYADELICGLSEEIPETDSNVNYHTHDESCYSKTTNLICQLASEEGHSHTDVCKTTEKICICTLEENEAHTHDESCFEIRESITCGQEESEGHIHGEECYETISVLTCGLEEILPPERHVHSEQCYQKKLVCELEEHDHTLACYSNKKADLETAEDWEKELPKKLTGVWADDLLTVAKTQLGYHESTNNYIVVGEDETKGYTRYGDWYGDSYGDWCAMFVSFCLNYAEIPESAIGYEANCQKWVEKLQDKELVQTSDTLETVDENLEEITTQKQYQASGTYTPKPGDLIFFEVSQKDRANHVGIVTEVRLAEDDNSENTVSEVDIIEGNSSDSVRKRTYRLDDESILGYGILPENPGYEDAAVQDEQLITKQTITAVIYTDETMQQISEEDKTVITISGLLPEGVSARAYAVTLEEELVDGKSLVFAYDITLYDKEGHLIETDSSDYPMTVTIEPEGWADGQQEVQPEDYQIYYIPEEGEPEPMDTTGEENAVSFQTNHFSTYALTVSGTNETIYLNGSSGDDSKAGTTAATAVKTFEKAASLVKEGGTIYITGTVTISDDQQLNFTNTVTVKRYSSFTGPLITVANGGNLVLGNLTINGGSGTPNYSDSSPTIATNSTFAGSAKAPLLVVETGGRLTVGSGTVLEYNSNVPDSSNNKFVENGYVGLGGAIYCSGTLTMNGGFIQYCEAQCGGGVYVENGSFYLTNGTIDHNFARDIVSYTNRVGNYHKNAGGGVYVGDNAIMTMSGGTISYNQSSREGGGISLGWLNRSNNAGISSYITTFTMNGGTITNNFAVSTGGGLNITAGRQAFINAGYITYNTAQGREYQDSSTWVSSGKYTTVFSGGGIYVDAAQWSNYASDTHSGVPGKAVINRAIITQNTATSNGGGIASCATSVNYVYGDETNGTAIYNNSSNEIYLYSSGSLELGNTLLGGGSYNWTKSGSTYDNSLTDSSAAVVKAQELATVYIMYNTGYLGGGIGCNGLIEIGGEKEESTYINIKKVWDDNGTIEHPEYIEVQILQDGEAYGDPIRIYRTYDEDGNEIWPTFYVGGLPSGHTYTVKELDVPGYMATIEQQGQDFIITNTPVGFQVIKKWVDEDGNTLTDNLPGSIEVQLYQNGVAYGYSVELNAENDWAYTWSELPEEDDDGKEYEYTAKEITIPEGFYSTSDGVLNENGNWEITNIKSPVTSVSVEKRWVDDTAEDRPSSILVQLYQGGSKYGEVVELSEENNWFYKWDNLPTKNSAGEDVTYQVEEIPVSGYTTELKVADQSDAIISSEWTAVSSLETGNTYVFVSDSGALAATASGFSWADVSNELATGGSLDKSVLWTYDGSTLQNGNGVYINTKTTGGFFTSYSSTFITGTSGYSIKFTSGYLAANVQTSRYESTDKYFGTISSNGTVSAVSSTSDATSFEAYTFSSADSSASWGDEHFIITNTKTTDEYELPETGGIGSDKITAGGAILVTASLLIGYIMIRRRERRIY